MDQNKAIIIAVIIICVGFLTFYFVTLKVELDGKTEKENLIDTLYLPKTATEIENHGNGWVTFHFLGKKVVFFRHPVDHQVDMEFLP